MPVRTHELHAAVVHAPLALIPAAALIDLSAVRNRNQQQARLGARMWWLAVASGVLAGVSGMAASQEVKADKYARDIMWLHGIGNVAVLGTTLAIALWRRRHGPGVLQSVLGLTAAGLSGFTAYLGGTMVYTHGVGVDAMPRSAAQGVGDSPPLFSAGGLTRLLSDAIKGAVWLADRGRTRPPGLDAIRRAAE